MEQRSTEWFLSRLGVFTGSDFKTIVHGRKDGKESLVLTNAAEILTQQWQEVTARSLEWGQTHEATAITEYTFYTNNEVQPVGLIFHPDSPFVGASPDGLVGEQGGVEVKCPQTSREHVRNLIHGMDVKEHGPQVQGCMWVTGRSWWDFISFDPRMPLPQRLYIERIHRDEDYIQDLSDKTWALIRQLETYMGQIQNSPEAA